MLCLKENEMREKVFKRTLAVLLAFVIAVAFSAASTAEVSAASKTLKMKAYDEVIKSGKYAYCATTNGIFKVNVKNGKSKGLYVTDGYGGYVGSMKKHGKYIYFLCYGPINVDVCRVSINGGKVKTLFKGIDTKCVEHYAISKKKIYVTYGYSDNKHKVMKLNGKAKKKTGVAAKLIDRKTNKKGWRVKEQPKGKYVYCYLKTPTKKIRISKFENPAY